MFHLSGSFEGHTDSVYAIAVGASNTDTFYSGGGDGQVVAWQLNQPVGRLVTRLPHSIYAMRFLPKWNALLVGHNYEGLHLLDLTKHREIASCRLSASALFAIEAYEDIAFVGTQQGSLYWLSLPDLKVLATQKIAQGPIRALNVSANEKLLFVGSSDGHIYALGLANKTKHACIPTEQNGVFSLCVLPSQAKDEVCRLLCGGKDGHICLFSLSLHKKQYTFQPLERSSPTEGHLKTIYALKYVKSLHVLAAASRDKHISLWHLNPLARIKRAFTPTEKHNASVNALDWVENKRLLLSASDDKRILKWVL